MKPKLPTTEMRTDLEMVRVPGGNGTEALTREILEERRNRLRKQNKKLDFEIELKEQQYGDIGLMRRQVLRANATVKQSLFAMAMRIAEQLALMEDPLEIQQFLLVQLSQAFNDLAYEHARTTTAD